jgi:hypothetical protein
MLSLIAKNRRLKPVELIVCMKEAKISPFDKRRQNSKTNGGIPMRKARHVASVAVAGNACGSGAKVEGSPAARNVSFV